MTMHKSDFQKLYAKRNEAFAHARAENLPGVEFDYFGRRLARRELVDHRELTDTATHGYLNPVSCVRYFEFLFASLPFQGPTGATGKDIRVLDVSSPRLFPFWLAEKAGVSVTMLNPDAGDLEQSRYQSRYVKGNKINFVDDFSGTNLPFPDNSFDVVSSISVIEHINRDGDIDMVREMVRVARPGGLIILTFPVKGIFDKEYRETRCYPTQEIDPERNAYFFQRFYDAEQIRNRLLNHAGMHEDGRAYFVETTPGWFTDYEDTWMRLGYQWIINDASFMAENFMLTEEHPSDRMGICGLFLRVDGEENS